MLEVIVNVVDYGLPLAAAIDRPRFHHQWPPREPEADVILFERDERFDLPRDTLAPLLDLGYTFGEIESLGDVRAVGIDGRQVTGVCDRRRTGGVPAAWSTTDPAVRRPEAASIPD